jgi:hypothetical protein
MALQDKLQTLFFTTAFQDSLFELQPSTVMQAQNFYNVPYSYDLLTQHAAGTAICAVAAVNTASMCNFVAIDFDNHFNDASVAAANQSQVITMFNAQSQYNPVLEASNTYGGYHLWLFLPSPMTAESALTLVQGIAGGGPETRPSSPCPIGATPYSNSNVLRLPGLNPSDETWSTIYVNGEWVDVRAWGNS